MPWSPSCQPQGYIFPPVDCVRESMLLCCYFALIAILSTTRVHFTTTHPCWPYQEKYVTLLLLCLDHHLVNNKGTFYHHPPLLIVSGKVRYSVATLPWSPSCQQRGYILPPPAVVVSIREKYVTAFVLCLDQGKMASSKWNISGSNHLTSWQRCVYYHYYLLLLLFLKHQWRVCQFSASCLKKNLLWPLSHFIIQFQSYIPPPPPPLLFHLNWKTTIFLIHRHPRSSIRIS